MTLAVDAPYNNIHSLFHIVYKRSFDSLSVFVFSGDVWTNQLYCWESLELALYHNLWGYTSRSSYGQKTFWRNYDAIHPLCGTTAVLDLPNPSPPHSINLQQTTFENKVSNAHNELFLHLPQCLHRLVTDQLSFIELGQRLVYVL